MKFLQHSTVCAVLDGKRHPLPLTTGLRGVEEMTMLKDDAAKRSIAEARATPFVSDYLCKVLRQAPG